MKNSFEYAMEIIKQDSRLFIASLDVEPLFHNTHLEETMYKWNRINHFTRNDFEKLLTEALQNNFFHSDVKNFKQIDGVWLMCSPLMDSLCSPNWWAHHWVVA